MRTVGGRDPSRGEGEMSASSADMSRSEAGSQGGAPPLPPPITPQPGPPPPYPMLNITGAHNTPMPGVLPVHAFGHLQRYYLPRTWQKLDPSQSLVWGRRDARALHWPIGKDDTLIEAIPSSGCTPLHIAFASRRWAIAADMLRDPAAVALQWLRALALRALHALDNPRNAYDEELRRLAESTALEAATAWHMCAGVVARATAPQQRGYTSRPQPLGEAGLVALAEAEDAEALIGVESLWPDGTESQARSAFGSTARRWVHQRAFLEDHDFSYSEMNVLHIAAANAAPLHLANAALRVAGVSEEPLACARCSVRSTIATGGQSADVPLGSEMQPVHVAIKADGAAELVQLFLQANGGKFSMHRVCGSHFAPVLFICRVSTGVSQWESTCRCTVWGATRDYSPLALAQHHQNKRLEKLLAEFQRDGSAASTSAALVTTMQRMLLCYLCDEYELDYDATVEVVDGLPPAPFATLMRFGKSPTDRWEPRCKAVYLFLCVAANSMSWNLCLTAALTG